MKRSPHVGILIATAICLAYCLAGELGLRLKPVGGFASLVWAPTGIALAALLLGGYRLWPLIALGAFGVNFAHGAEAIPSAGVAAGNTMEALVGTYLLREVAAFRYAFDRLRDCAWFVLLAAVLSTLISATIGVASLHFGGIIAAADLEITWLAWWLGDMLGALTIAPLILVWSRTPPAHDGRVLEASALALSALAVTLIVFDVWRIDWITRFPKLYLLFPIQLWACFRFGQHAGVALTVLISALALASTLYGVGLFTDTDVASSLIHLQTFLATLAVTSLAVAAANAERRQGQVELTRANEALEHENVERVRLEEQLRQKLDELAEADQRKDEFLAMLAHELRNPLASITSALAVLTHPDASETQGQEMRGIVERQLRNLISLVDDLLDVSRLTRGKIALRKTRLDLREPISLAVKSAEPAMESRRHRLRISVPSKTLPIEADPARIEQILVNLLSNAAKYTPPGGDIELRAEVEGETAVLRVRDTGIGMDAQMLERAFDLFVQADQSLDRSHGGLGIGLTLVKSLVELHGGCVVARSEGHGKGTEVEVRLPLCSTPIAARRESASLSAVEPASSLSILVVDDNKDVAETLRAMLEIWGHRVEVAHDGRAALAALLQIEPRVVLLDIGLPEIDGYEVARRIRRASGARIALVALTGYGRKEDQAAAREAGFDAHLLKPVGPQELSRLLNEIGAGRARE